MIHDVDETLRRILESDVLPGSDVTVTFEAPTKDWAARRSGPTLNVYLYDIREDVKRREVMYERVGGAITATSARQPARMFRLAYLMTAWTVRPEDEHRLLSACLECFLRYDALPRESLVGGLAEAGISTLATIAQPPGDQRKATDIWSAIGGELKPSLDLVVTAPFVPGREISLAAPVDAPPEFALSSPEGHSETVSPRRSAEDQLAADAQRD
jgi:hypothetical protein